MEKIIIGITREKHEIVIQNKNVRVNLIQCILLAAFQGIELIFPTLNSPLSIREARPRTDVTDQQLGLD